MGDWAMVIDQYCDMDWVVSPNFTDYDMSLADMESRAAAISAGTATERIWLLQHTALYTAGTSASADELLDPRFPVYRVGRGGRYSYHGPGQRVGYVQLDLTRRGRDVRRYIQTLEGWLITALARLGVHADTAEGRIGIWVRDCKGDEAKIGAIGVRISRWVTQHGFAININPTLEHFSGIVPCGLAQFPVTSLAALGVTADMADFDQALRDSLPCFLDRLTPDRM